MKLLTLSSQLEGFLPHPTTGIVVLPSSRVQFPNVLHGNVFFCFYEFQKSFFSAKNCGLSRARHLFRR